MAECNNNTCTIGDLPETTRTASVTLSALRLEADSWYGIRVLVFDLSNEASTPL